MEPNQIFQAVEETQFLKILSSQSKLFFIGDTASLEHIKSVFRQYKNNDDNYYYNLPERQLEALAKVADLNLYRAIVVVSLEDETVLSSEVKQQLKSISHPVVLQLFSDIFVNRLSNCALLQPVAQQHKKPEVSYAILTTPRSGSTYLCDLLDSTAIAGHPSEHLRFAAQELSLYSNFDYLRLLDSVMEHRTTSNSVFGTKVISHFLFELQKAKPDFKQIFRAIDKFILLIRKDKVAQAVSLELAQKTEVWHIHHDAKKASYKSQLDSIEIDDSLLDDVAKKVSFIKQQENLLKNILANNNIEPLVVVYEDILEDASTQINRILNFLEISKPPGHTLQISSGIKRMPSNISQEIIRRHKEREKISS